MQRITTAALIALLAAAGPVAGAQRETETFDRTVPFVPNGTLKLRNFSGDVKVTGYPGTDVVIHAVRRATRERLDNIRLDVQASGSTIEIEANRRNPEWREKNDNVVETDFEVQVPSGTELDIHAFSSPIETAGVAARQKLYAFSGRLTVRNSSGGPLEVQTFSGTIDLDLSAAAEVPSLDVETFSGDVQVRMPQVGGGRVEFRGFSGDFNSDFPLTLRSGSRRSLDAEFGAGNATIRFKTFSGDVRLLK
ncbi:MAG TPA: DUF4097 family beta strand repeat-containing protein [Vicinamibacterales bacterium]|nr:DUF4097 family beta strand repeat-containing protein [Vicinamibacterales bacterium]